MHAPTMELPAVRTTEEKVYRATKAALVCAEAISAKSIAIPGMGTGVGMVPHQVAARAMMRAIMEFSKLAKSIEEILLCDLDEKMIEAWREELSK